MQSVMPEGIAATAHVAQATPEILMGLLAQRVSAKPSLDKLSLQIKIATLFSSSC